MKKGTFVIKVSLQTPPLSRSIIDGIRSQTSWRPMASHVATHWNLLMLYSPMDIIKSGNLIRSGLNGSRKKKCYRQWKICELIIYSHEENRIKEGYHMYTSYTIQFHSLIFFLIIYLLSLGGTGKNVKKALRLIWDFTQEMDQLIISGAFGSLILKIRGSSRH